MKPSIQAIRTIAVEFVWRMFLPIAIITPIVAVALIVLSLYLTTLHDAWWILAVIVIALSVAAALGLFIAWMVIKVATPSRTKAQKQQAKALVDKLQRVSEVATTPVPLVFFRVLKDVASPNADGFIGSLTADSSSLKNDFLALRDSFTR